MATPYQKRMMTRRTSDLTRLAEQYKKNVQAMTGEYETEFAKFQQEREAAMAPYNEAVRRYRETDMPAYEAAVAAYQKRLDDFNRAMEDYESNPSERIQNQRFIGGRGQQIQIEGKTYSLNDFKGPADVSIKYEGNKAVAYRDRPMPKMSGSAPKAPATPQAPQVAEFDQAQFEQKRGQLQQEYQREVGERRSSRLAAVRRTGRTLLKDA